MIILLLILGLALIGLHRFFAYWGEQESKAQVRRMQRYMQANKESK